MHISRFTLQMPQAFGLKGLQIARHLTSLPLDRRERVVDAKERENGMSSLHQVFLNTIHEQRTLGRVGGPAYQRMMAIQTTFADDVEVLNFALTLEHLEAAFYEMAGEYDLGEDPYGNLIGDYVAIIGQHETDHVTTLTQVITDLGGEPVARAEYDFGVTDAQTFLATAATLENVGVAAYDGAGQFIQSPELLTAAGTIVAVEARHAAYLNVVIGENPFPAAFETPMTPDEVLEAAGPFIISQ